MYSMTSRGSWGAGGAKLQNKAGPTCGAGVMGADITLGSLVWAAGRTRPDSNWKGNVRLECKYK